MVGEEIPAGKRRPYGTTQVRRRIGLCELHLDNVHGKCLPCSQRPRYSAIPAARKSIPLPHDLCQPVIHVIELTACLVFVAHHLVNRYLPRHFH